MKIIKKKQRTWTNRHDTFTENIKDLYTLGNEANLDALSSYNDATRGFLNMIGEAIATQTPLRSLGAGWSWTKIATVNNGVMLDTKPLNTRFNISKNSVANKCTKDPEFLVFAQSGMSIQELDEFLLQKGQSLKTSGASNGQTIAGAISTGVHGSAFDFGAIPEFVVGLHLIVGANRHVYLERATDPIVSNQFIQNIQAEHILDDALFNAALVSFGSFGIIHGVMIETEKVFLLETYMQRLPYDNTDKGKVLKEIMQTLNFQKAGLPHGNERPYHFSVLLNPYDMAKGAYVTTMYKRPYVQGYPAPTHNPAGIGPGDDAPAFIGLVTDANPAMVPTLVNKLLGASLTVSKTDTNGKPIPQTGTVGEIFNNTTLRGQLLSAAIGFPISHINQVADLILKANESIGPFAGLLSFRFVKKSKATLGFTKFDQTCVMELDAAKSDKVYKFYTQIWKLLEDHHIPFTFHWGKILELSPARINNMYGADATAWKAARNKLLDANTRKVFTIALLQQWGLD
ncbi:FAD binding domain-containing protein [Filimonas lacunae]|uniref:FAD binding domain-containing protein n=1 Tax=Filimonas lacunae TaxID=477680 RepID=A0A173MGY6_9BACT|nr:FAD-binding protein [Filimonas lacunae]BAV06691.1 FAD-linked oxidoreductase [Filimonas lacunae]SIT27923.1 FAD binding domain-containing protein [Filimonas lacunae]